MAAPHVVRVFVSSTFRDMQAERDELGLRVFPELRDLCEKRGVIWGDVDLRWGITDEQRLRGDVLPICLAEIDRCRPYFVAMLGERYGWECTAIPPELVSQHQWLDGRVGTSITELELLHGALNHAADARRAFVYLRAQEFLQTVPTADREAFAELPTPDELQTLGRKDARACAEAREGKLAALKQRIRQSGLRIFEGYHDAKELGNLVLADLSRAICEDFPGHGSEDSALRESRIHENYAESRMHFYLRRLSDFRKLDTHADGAGPPLVVIGESGVGKTALLANWIEQRRKLDPTTAIVPYYVGASGESTGWRHLVTSIMERLGFPVGGDAHDDEALRVAFANVLHRATATRRIVLVVDAVNQLDDGEGALDLAWLPVRLPENLRLFLSTLDGRVAEACRRRQWPFHTVRRLAPRQRERLLNAYLHERYGKTLAPAQRARITAASLSANPLWLTSVLEELSLIGDPEALDARISYYLAALSIPDLFGRILARWEEDYERDRTGLVGDAMAALWASRRGLSETELRELLGDAAGPLPALTWSVFQFAAARSLLSRSGRLSFFHDYLRDAVGARYLATGDDERAAHRRIASYFETQKPSSRRTDELAWQFDRAESWAKLADLLSDLDFFHDAWEANELDVKRYWARLEANAHSRVDAYRLVIESPAAHVRDADAVATLLDEAGHLREALSIYERLATGFEQSAEPLERARALTKLGRVRDVLGNRDEALDAHAIAERIFRNAGRRQDLLVSLGYQAQIHIRQGAPDRARVCLREALRLARDLGDQQSVQSLLVSQAEMLIEEDALDKAERRLDEAEQICLKLADQDALQRLYGYRSSLRYKQHQLDDALHFSELKERICEELGDDGGRAAALNTRAVLLSDAGHVGKALGLLDDAEEIYRRIGSVSGLATVLGNRGSIKHQEGELREAAGLFEQQETLYRQHGELADLDSVLFNLALTRGQLGDSARALELLDDAAGAAERTEHRGVRAEIRMHRGRILSKQGNHVDALPELQEAARELGDVGNRWEQARAFRFMSNTLLAAERPAAALVAARQAERLAREMKRPSAIADALDCRANVLEHEGELIPALGVRRRELELRRALADATEVLATAGKVITVAHKAGDISALIEAIDVQADALTRLGRLDELVVKLEQVVAQMKGRADLDRDNRRYLTHLQTLVVRLRKSQRRARETKSRAGRSV